MVVRENPLFLLDKQEVLHPQTNALCTTSQEQLVRYASHSARFAH